MSICNFKAGDSIIHTINNNELMVISNEENFKKIKEMDIAQELKCNFGYYLPFGPIFYYFRNNNKSKLIELFDKKLSEKEKEKLEKARKNFPYLFSFYE